MNFTRTEEKEYKLYIPPDTQYSETVNLGKEISHIFL